MTLTESKSSLSMAKTSIDFENKRFSVTILPERVRLYTCSRYDYMNMIVHFRLYDVTTDVLCQTFLGDEITFYMYIDPTSPDHMARHTIFTRSCTSDQRVYYVVDIHEDLPGIDHIGIIHYLSGEFQKQRIPILYVNTYGHNLILIGEDHMTRAKEVLERIAYCE
jgi:hypothetical protein